MIEKKHPDITAEYNAYLESPEWETVRKRRILFDDYTCQLCGMKFPNDKHLTVHHLHYKHAMRESENDAWKDDLVTLCVSCHRHVHQMMERNTANGKHGWADSLTCSRHVLHPEANSVTD